MNRVFMFLSALIFMSCGVHKNIIEKPIIFNAERAELTKSYLKERYGLAGNSTDIIPKMVVLHWTVIPTLEKSFEAFNQVTLPNWRPDIKNVSGLNVSAHFLVDRDGTIYRLLSETTMARHVIGLNHCAIGIENVGGDKTLPLTRQQLRSNKWLVRYLKDTYSIDYVIGHFEYTQFVGHDLWLEKDESYRTVKTDPGPRFLRKVKRATKQLNFKETPRNTSN